MVIYSIRVLTPFNDIKTGKLLRIGETLEVDSETRARSIVNQGLGEIQSARHEGKRGKKVLIYQIGILKIGGVETANRQLVKAFPEADITFVYEKADQTQLLEIAKNASVILDDRLRNYEADVLILANYDGGPKIINRVKAGKIYQFIHTDWDAFTKLWAGFRWKPNEKIDKFISVSETAKTGVKNAFGVDSIVCRNILNPIDEAEQRKVFLVLSRATKEKGIDRVLELADRFEAAGKDFVFFLSSTIDSLPEPERRKIKSSSRILVVPPSPYSKELLRSADYLVQLSKLESYCYSVREALQMSVPVIVSDIPVFREIVRDSENGYILNDDFSNLDVERIFNEVPKPEPYTEEIDPTWKKILNGEL